MDKNLLFATATLTSNDTWYKFKVPECLGEFDHVEQLKCTDQKDYYYCWFDCLGKERGNFFYVGK